MTEVIPQIRVGYSYRGEGALKKPSPLTAQEIDIASKYLFFLALTTIDVGNKKPKSAKSTVSMWTLSRSCFSERNIFLDNL